MKFDLNVIHSFPLQAGDELDGAVLSERTFVDSGEHVVTADAALINSLDSSGYVEILAVDGQVKVWEPCCSDGSHH